MQPPINRMQRLSEVVFIRQLVVRLVQVEVVHYRFSVCLLALDHLGKEFIFAGDTINDDVPRL